MPKAIVHCGIEEYAIEVDGVRSDPEEYGDPVLLVANGVRYCALIAEVDRARTSLFGAAYIIKVGADVPCVFKSYEEFPEEDEEEVEEEDPEAEEESDEDDAEDDLNSTDETDETDDDSEDGDDSDSESEEEPN